MAKKTSKGRETIAAALTLVALAGIVSAVIIKQSQYDKDRFDPTTAIPGNASAEEAGLDLKSTLPDDLVAISPAEYFDRDNLYVKINGKAPVYLDAGFKALHCLRFAPADARDKWMEIFVYDMAKPQNAFSVYSVQRRAQSKPSDLTQFSYTTSNAVYMSLGPYYIEVVAAEESQQLKQATTAVAKSLVENLSSGETQQMQIMQYLPADGRHDDTLNLHLSNTFGSEALSDIFTVEYERADDIQAFIAQRENVQAAAEMAQAYQTFLTDNGAEKVGDIEGCDGGVYDFFGMTEIVCTRANFVFGVHEAMDREAAEKLTKEILSKIDEVTDSASE